jgi:molybdate transport system substrate-binding protein
MDLPGLELLGPLPPAVQIVTTFSAARTAGCEHPEAAQALLGFLAAPERAASKRRHGMSPP